MKKYSNASFKGTYGFSAIYGANAAIGLGIAVSDGRGNFKATQTTNMGGQVIKSEISGTYVINPDGTGSATVSFNNPDGTMQKGNFFYVVLVAKETNSGKLATELQGMAVEPGPGGALGLTHFKLIP
jgi:hypothetical protein